ncbi:bacterial Ig-like domain-containing protein, partial [Enterococcus faecalis]
TVKEDQTSLETKNSTLGVGEKSEPENNALNLIGNIPEPPEDIIPLSTVFDVNGIIGDGKIIKNGTVLHLTDGRKQSSAMWSKEKLDFTKKFTIRAYIYLGNDGRQTADGMTLTFQNGGRNAIGLAGQHLGAYNGLTMPRSSLSIEMDTYHNGDGNDRELPVGQHVAIVSHRRPETHYPAVTGLKDLSDGTWKTLTVIWNPDDRLLSYLFEHSGKAYFTQQYLDSNIYPGDKVYWGFTSATGAQWTNNAVAFAELPQNMTIETKDSTLYVGEKWNPKDNFVSAIDERGKKVTWGDERITTNGAKIDTSKPGIHKIKYTLKGRTKNVDSEFTVTVKEDQTKAELKDDELYVGQKWDLGRVFKNVVDKDGNSMTPDQVKFVWIDGKENVKEIDTSKPGKHTVSLAILNVKNEWVYSNKVTVTVKEESFIIKQVPYFDFDDHILGSTNKSVANNKETPIIELETPSIVAKDWQLQVELSPFVDKNNEKNVLKGVSLFIPKGKLESDLATEEPNQYECKLEANGKASILMNGTKAKGKGRWKNKLETKEITLSIPSENKTGDFESTLHWTLLDVPI